MLSQPDSLVAALWFAGGWIAAGLGFSIGHSLWATFGPGKLTKKVA